MGIYTLHSYKYKGFRLRVRNNALEGKVRLIKLLSDGYHYFVYTPCVAFRYTQLLKYFCMDMWIM